MGVLAAIGSGVAIANGVAVVLEKLDGDRSVVLEVQNHTSKPLRVARHHHDHGGFAEPPNQEIPPGMADLFGSQDRGFLTGTEGSVVYQSEVQYFLRISWNNPFVNGNECGSGLSGEKAAAFKATSICGSGNTGAHMKYEVRQVLDPKFVRSPDYIWSRLHGYAYAPGTRDLENVVELHNWWSDGLKDNFATTFYTSPEVIVSPDYHHSRLEGLIFRSPPDDVDTVPLYNWVSLEHSDNFATTAPVYTQPPVMEIPPDYGSHVLLGFLFSPDRPAPANTVPIHHWFSRSRRDNFITSQEGWRP